MTVSQTVTNPSWCLAACIDKHVTFSDTVLLCWSLWATRPHPQAPLQGSFPYPVHSDPWSVTLEAL